MESALLNTYNDITGPAAVQSEGGFIVLVDAQTGLGKTYQATSLQLEHLIADTGKKVIYATNLRINVIEAYDDLRARINDDQGLTAQRKQQLLANVILVPAQKTSIELLTNDDWPTLLDALNSNENQSVKNAKDGIRLLEQAVAAIESANLSPLNDEISQRYNKLFNLLLRIFRAKLNKLEITKDSEVYRILTKMLPASRIEDDVTQIVFMTTAKLLYPWHAIARNLRISDVLQDALIIFDEFDRQQKEFLNHLIKDSGEFDIISLVRRLYASFSSYEVTDTAEFEGVETSFDKFRVLLNKFDSTWKISFRPFITDSTLQAASENQKRVFTLLSDRMSLHAINFRHDELRSHIDSQLGTHEIGENGGQNAIRYLNSASRLIRMFCNGMLSATNTLANNLQKVAGCKPHSSEDLVVKVLNHFGLAELKKEVLSLINTKLSFRIDRGAKEYSFHDSGFEISKASKYSELDNTATAATFELALTPTGLLANWVLGGAKILGISATASSETVIHNFDLTYMKNMLGDQFIELTPQQKQGIQHEYTCKRRYEENNVKITATDVSSRDLKGGIQRLYKEYVGDFVDELMLEQKIANLLMGENAEIGRLDFAIKRVNKIIAAIKNFSSHPSNRYLFCMLNNSYKTPEFYQFMDFVGRKYGVQIFANINAASFRNDEFKAVLRTLENTAQKVAVITNYQATGAGLSPSYKIKNTDNLIYIGQKGIDPYQFKTDIDAIYLEQPKSLIGDFVSFEQTYEDRNLAIKKNIHDALMLHEQGLIAPNDIKPMLKSFIATNIKSSAVGELRNFYKNTQDYRFAVFRFVEQALGRMCRTEWKQSAISIMFDAESDFIETLASDHRDLSHLSVEYKQLITAIKHDCKAELVQQKQLAYSAKATRNHAHLQRLITNVYQHQNKDAIGQYNRVRHQALMAPTLKAMPPGDYFRYYIQSSVPGCYTYNIDYSNEETVTQIFINSDDHSSPSQVSAFAARLDILMQNRVVREHFKANDFATLFGDDHVLIAPAVFDIYMGAVGEEAVFALLQDFDYQVCEMPQGTTEWFDGYITIGNRILLIDVKHWNLGICCLAREFETMTKCENKLVNLRKDLPKAFEGKSLQAFYINAICEAGGTITGSKFSEQEARFIEYASLVDADVIDVPGLIDSETGQTNTRPMTELLNLLENLKGIDA
jgi:hypothetical protein